MMFDILTLMQQRVLLHPSKTPPPFLPVTRFELMLADEALRAWAKRMGVPFVADAQGRTLFRNIPLQVCDEEPS